MKSLFSQQVPWLLDFDADYAGCPNPFQEELKAFLGSPLCGPWHLFVLLTLVLFSTATQRHSAIRALTNTLHFTC